MVCQTYCFPFLGAQPTECSIKLPFLSVLHQFGIFLRNCSLFFFDIWIFALRSLSPMLPRFYEKFQDSYFSEHRKRILILCIFLAELKPVLLGNFHLFSASWNGKTQNKDLFLWNKALISFQLKVYPLFHWSWYAIFIKKALTEWTIFDIKTFSFVSSVLIK